jgi:hypothetical protein
LCGEADSTLDQLNDPLNANILEALHELWRAANLLAENLVDTQSTLREWILPRKMSCNEIALSLYGSAERASEISQLNGIADPYSVAAGTTIRYQDTA